VSLHDAAETLIFDLRKQAGLYLQSLDTEEVNRILTTIAHLQKLYGVTKGAERKENNARTA
jgi:hypothetical protein